MKVKDFIKQIESLGYSDDTEISIGCPSYGGDWYDFEFRLDADDMPQDDIITLTVEPSTPFMKAEMEQKFSDLKDNLFIYVEDLFDHIDCNPSNLE